MNNLKWIIAALAALWAGQMPLFAQTKTTRIVVIQDSSKRSETEQIWIDYGKAVKAWADSVNQKIANADIPPLPQIPPHSLPLDIDVQRIQQGDSTLIRVEVQEEHELKKPELRIRPQDNPVDLEMILEQEGIQESDIVRKQITRQIDPETGEAQEFTEITTRDGTQLTINNTLLEGKTTTIIQREAAENQELEIMPNPGEIKMEFQTDQEFTPDYKPKPKRKKYGPSSATFLSLGTGIVTNAYSPTLALPYPVPGLMPELKPISTNLNFDMMHGLNLIRGKLRLYTGLGYSYQAFEFEDRSLTVSDQSNTFQAEIASSQPELIKRSQLNSHWVSTPIAIGFQDRPNDPEVQFITGVYGYYNLRTNTEIKMKDGSRSKTVGDFCLNDWALSPFAQLQFDGFGLYARYHMSNLFKSKQASNPPTTEPSANLLQFGVVFGGS
jgi:hypothetical protein